MNSCKLCVCYAKYIAFDEVSSGGTVVRFNVDLLHGEAVDYIG
jgi:hypothetical protein